jgi:hypothetical protein
MKPTTWEMRGKEKDETGSWYSQIKKRNRSRALG